MRLEKQLPFVMIWLVTSSLATYGPHGLAHVILKASILDYCTSKVVFSNPC